MSLSLTLRLARVHRYALLLHIGGHTKPEWCGCRMIGEHRASEGQLPQAPDARPGERRFHLPLVPSVFTVVCAPTAVAMGRISS